MSTLWPIENLEEHFVAGTTYGEITKGQFPEGLSLPREMDKEVTYPWDLLRLNEEIIATLQVNHISGEVSPSANINGVICLGEGSQLLPGVYIEGNVVIGKNCKIGPNCYIRGNTAIGDNCHIGNAVEVKNSLISHDCNIGHLSYVGDSILGHKVNFGAGTITANLRHDGKTQKSLVERILVETGRRKMGVITGSHVHTGINTSLLPGRKLGSNTFTLPGQVTSKDQH